MWKTLNNYDDSSITVMEWLLKGFGLMMGFIGLFDTARDYTLQFTIRHALANIDSHIFTDRCSVAASSSGRSPSSGFPKLSPASATSF
jgi:hypothetical protein